MRAAIVLTPAESKSLIAKAVARKPEVRKALQEAYLILCEGSTNLFLARELFGLRLACESFTSGMSCGGVLCNSAREVRGRFPLVAYRGELVDIPYEKALDHFHKDTVIIKGGNAVDPQGFVGIIVSGFTGGCIARVIGNSISQGIRVVCPIGLEKAVFSVPEAARRTGGKRFDYSMGADYGLFVLAQADVVTEIQAIAILTGAEAVHVASGGIGGSEGAVIVSVEGTERQVRETVRFVEGVKGEPLMRGTRMECTRCKYVNCTFYGREKAALPLWMASGRS